jgi:hypothetical protein
MSQSGQAASAAKLLGQVNFDFVPTAPNQMALTKGTVITILQKGDPGGWSKGVDEFG